MCFNISHSSAWGRTHGVWLGSSGHPCPRSTSAAGILKLEATCCCPSKYIPLSLLPRIINNITVQMENCKKTCLQGLAKPGPRGWLQPCLVWGSSSPRCHHCACKKNAHSYNLLTEGLPYPPKQNRAGVERACFQKCGLFPVCGMDGTSKPRHLCARPAVPAQDPL